MDQIRMKEKNDGDWGSVRNLPQILQHGKECFSGRVAVESVDGTSYTYPEMESSARFLASILWGAGIGKGDRVALLSENSPHWGISYFGILACGATTVPILPDFRTGEIQAILEHAKARSLFVSGKLFPRLPEVLPETVELVVNMDSFQVLHLEGGRVEPSREIPGRIEKLALPSDSLPGEDTFYRAGPGDLAAIIYTSGTTGMSKGVMLSHDNILSNARQSRTIHKVVPADRFLSMLPLAHTYESTIGMVVPLLSGAQIRYLDRPPTASYLGPILKSFRPTTVLTVPLIMEKIFAARIQPGLYGTPLMRILMKAGPTRRLLSRAAAGKLKRFFGGALRFYGIGGAPLSPQVERFLLDGNFPYAIGYGLTETSPLLAGFNPRGAVYRSVGTVLEGVELKIHEPDPVTGEGEIVARGPNIMQGYYRDPERTSEAFTAEGYFRTGDLGLLNRKGIVYIRGRLKNMILGPNGENIYPEEIEAVINREELVSESLVMEYKGKLVARVHLRLEVLEESFHHLKENAAEFQNQIQEKAQEILDDLMIRVNQHVARNAKLQRMVLQLQPFEKTPTQKIKRFLYQNLP
jgi:long-chain acyl-CoA synthetase